MLVHFWETRETADGTRAPIVGRLSFRPIRSRVITGTPDEEVLPDPFSVALDSDGKADVPLAETSAANPAWEVSLYVEGGSGWGPVYVMVPEGVECDWPDLVRVDPATLAPAAAPEAAWWAAIEGITDDIGVAVADYLDANPPTADVTMADLTGHAADTTAVHGIADTSALVVTTDARLSDARTPLAHTHAIADTTGLQSALDGKAATGHTHAEMHTHANAAALALVSGTNTGDEPAASTTAAGIVELATTAEASAGTDTTRAVTPAGVAAAIAGVGGGVTDHGALTGLADDDHALYALADGTRGAFAATSHTHTASQISDSTVTGRTLMTAATATAARTAIGAAPALGNDDNYVTDAEKLALHSHTNKTALDAVSGTNTGDQDLSGYALTSSLGTAATTDATDYATASHTHTAADITDHTEAVQDVVGDMVVQAGGTYDDGAGTITLPSGGGGGGMTPAYTGTSTLWLPLPGSVVIGSGTEYTYPANRLFCFPFSLSAPVTLTTLGFNVNTGVGGAVAYVWLYTDAGGGQPGTLVADLTESGRMPLDTAGLVTLSSLSQSLDPGQYVFQFKCSANCLIRTHTLGGLALSSASALAARLFTNGVAATIAPATPVTWAIVEPGSFTSPFLLRMDPA